MQIRTKDIDMSEIEKTTIRIRVATLIAIIISTVSVCTTVAVYTQNIAIRFAVMEQEIKEIKTLIKLK